MKKILSTLVCMMISGALLVTTACGSGGKGEKKILSGTNAAKIALARERLDENVFKEEMSFWDTQESVVGVKSNATAKSGAVRLAAKRAKITASASTPDCEAVDGKVRWSHFGNNSMTMTNFQNVFKEIEIDASQVAESIGYIKKNVGVTNQWLGGHQLLIVDESRETLVEKYHFEDPNTTGYQVAHRYTREDAKNIYDIYSYWQEPAQSGQLRMKYIPGEYYESSYMHSSGFSDYFMAENSSGYWKLSRFSGNREDNGSKSLYIENYTIKDGLGIGFMYNTYQSEESAHTSVSYDVFDTTTSQDLFRATEYEESSEYFIASYLGNIASGLAYVEVDEKDAREEEEGIWACGGVDAKLVFDGGKVGQIPEDMRFVAADIGYDYMYKKYHGMASMTMSADSLIGALEKTEAFWTSNGATLKTSLSSLADAASYAEAYAGSFEDTFEWNGYKAATFEGMDNGEKVLKDFFTESIATYNEVKDYATVEYTKDEIVVSSFATIDVLDAAQSTYADGKITLNNAALTISDTTFLEVGGEYVLKVGLALKNEAGIQSVNTVVLDTESEQKVAFAEGATSLTVAQSGEYAVPTNLSEGNYVVVAYVATADEGIRVSEMKEVAFGEVTEGEVSSSAMRIDVKKAGDGLSVHYGVLLNVQATIDPQENYTLEDLERALTRAVLTYGYPKTGEAVTTEDGEIVTAETEIVAGTYKVKFLMNTEEGMAEAYAYVTVE